MIRLLKALPRVARAAVPGLTAKARLKLHAAREERAYQRRLKEWGETEAEIRAKRARFMEEYKEDFKNDES